MKLPINIPEGTRFTCQSCGRCCQGWTVPVDEETVKRLRAHDWGGEPFEPLKGSSHPYRIRLVNDRCFFLDAKNHCRIHNEISYEAKPAGCRAFPLAVLEVAGAQYARLSYWCPTVVANEGKLLENQGRWLTDTARSADHRSAPLMINDRAEIGSRAFEQVHRALRRVMQTRHLPVADRLAANAALIRRLDQAAAKAGAAAVEQVVRAAESEGVAALAAETRRVGHASGGRRALTLYLLQNRRQGRGALVARLVSILSYNVGLTRLRCQAVAARASRQEIRGAAFSLSGSSDDLLTRYFSSKLDSRRYVAGDATLVTGFNLLMAAYGIINVLARMRAVSHGRQASDEEDVRAAVGAADLLVVEHPNLQHSRVHRRLAQVTLGASSFSSDMLAFLEENAGG